MNKIIKLFFLVFLSQLALTAHAETENQGYELITPVQPVEDPEKVEVIEFFWYGCPHCYSFEPALKKWLATQGDNIHFIRMPAIFNKVWGRHAKLFFTAQALGVDEELNDDIFDAIQNNKQKLGTEDEMAEFFVAHGVDEQKFRSMYNSFMVDAQMRKAETMAPRYGVRSVPTMIINGKYKTNASIAKGQQNITIVMDQLVAAESVKQ